MHLQVTFRQLSLYRAAFAEVNDA